MKGHDGMGAGAALEVTSNFPGGNIAVDACDGDVVRVHQELRDTDRWWFYWCFELKSDVPRGVRVEFTDGDVLGPLGPAVSTDRGRRWRWLGPENINGQGFRIDVGGASPALRLCMTMPYQLSDLERFGADVAPGLPFRFMTLCESRHGRAVPLWRFGAIDGGPMRVLLTARHHACESMASYELEGLIGLVLGDTPEGAWLRRNVEFVALPLVDIDGVEAGDQGKYRRPRDHWLDYDGPSVHPEVRALREADWIWGDGRLVAALDLHCPYISGYSHDHIALLEPGPSATPGGFERFSEALRESCQRSQSNGRSLPYDARHNLRFGQLYNVETCFASWAVQLPGVDLAVTVELPYAVAGRREVNTTTAREFGADVGRALSACLRGRRGAGS